MNEFKHQTFGMLVKINAAELDKQYRREIPYPIWCLPLLWVGLLRPRYETFTTRQVMEAHQRQQAAAMQRAREAMEACLFGKDKDA